MGLCAGGIFVGSLVFHSFKIRIMKIDSLSDALVAISDKSIQYGINKDYCFVLDNGNGEIVFLKRISDDKREDPELQWPCNASDGDVLFSLHAWGSTVETVEEFLNALNIEYLS